MGNVEFENVKFVKKCIKENLKGPQPNALNQYEPSNKVWYDTFCDNNDSTNSGPSDIFQGDAADSIGSLSNYNTSNNQDATYDTDDEAYNVREPVVLAPTAQQPVPGAPLVLEVDQTGRLVLPSSLPLIMMTNARSLYNKIDNFTKWLLEIFPDCALVSETWEHETRRVGLEDLLAGTPFKVLSYRRPGGRTGGCCAIIFNESKFVVEEVHADNEDGIEVFGPYSHPEF